MPPETSRAETALELRGVSKYFGDLAALRKVSVRIERGDTVLVYGPNGAGKTTLLRTLATLARPSEGQVFFAGQDLHQNAAAGRAAMGFVSHATFLYGELTARENLRFTSRLFGLREPVKRIEAVLELFSLRERADEPVRGLSRGLQQRVTLARALLHDPTFLLLDEPFTGLDAASRENLESLLRRLPEQGKAVVFSTHDFDQGVSLSRRLVAMEAGRIRYDGPLNLAPLASLHIAPAR
ncbi:MAG: heme ABC exporter ATP-binding protein CcmA [Acidobacteriia bacterium]|nr:heme ABC exporter ATP-binding protein CcmA [Terriglobia bacterium]